MFGDGSGSQTAVRQPTKKGFAVAIHHLPAVKALIEAALSAADAIETSERPQTPTPTRSDGGAS